MIGVRAVRVVVLLCAIASAAVFADANELRVLDARLAQLRSGGVIAPDVFAALYELRGNTLLWDEPRRSELIVVLSRADLEGLDPRDYRVDALRRLPSLDELSGDARVDADIELTEALLRYVYQLRFGKVDPATHDPNWNFPRRVRSEDPIAALGRIFSTSGFAEALGSFEPPGPLYVGLKAQLSRYRALAAAGGWSPVDSALVLKPGMTDASVPGLRHRLAKEGFGDGALDSRHYDEPLEKLVRAFQKQNGLNADGVVGAQTRQALNVSAEQRVEQIRVNLERLRWMDGARTTRFLAVNVAGFEVHLIDQAKSIWSARAQVGTPLRQTPIFTADMKYVVFNPDWTVPPTILRDDVLPAVAKNPEYLATKHMEVVDRNRSRIDPKTIDWKRYPAAPFPYTIRQVPGPWNALGRVKFIFPNSHFVFLHDTPSQQLFARSERMFSSGCIRVERPFELVQLLLPGWDQGRIDQVLQGGAETTVFLPQPMPVVVAYLTALALQDGTVRFYRDIYDRDAWVSAALAADFVYHAPEGLPGR
jgi:murein L,D-transpeptidase YcbB/YkuD